MAPFFKRFKALHTAGTAPCFLNSTLSRALRKLHFASFREQLFPLVTAGWTRICVCIHMMSVQSFLQPEDSLRTRRAYPFDITLAKFVLVLRQRGRILERYIAGITNVAGHWNMPSLWIWKCRVGQWKCHADGRACSCLIQSSGFFHQSIACHLSKRW